jgi:dihydroxy-acid dehydratase
VLHLLALAHEADVDLSLDDFNRIGAHVPLLANLRPHGKYSYTQEFDEVGGVPVLMNVLLRAGLLHGGVMTCTGHTLAENLAAFPADFPPFQDVVYPIGAPFAPPLKHIVVVRGSLCPEGAVIKLGGKELGEWQGTANVYDEEAAAFAAIMGGEVKAGDALVLRYQGPKGGPGMPELLQLSGVAAPPPPPPYVHAYDLLPNEPRFPTPTPYASPHRHSIRRAGRPWPRPVGRPHH